MLIGQHIILALGAEANIVNGRRVELSLRWNRFVYTRFSLFLCIQLMKTYIPDT